MTPSQDERMIPPSRMNWSTRLTSIKLSCPKYKELYFKIYVWVSTFSKLYRFKPYYSLYINYYEEDTTNKKHLENYLSVTRVIEYSELRDFVCLLIEQRNGRINILLRARRAKLINWRPWFFCLSVCLSVCLLSVWWNFSQNIFLSIETKSFEFGSEYSRTGFKKSWLSLNDNFLNLSRKSVFGG